MDSLLMISGAAGGLGSALAVEAARLGYDLVLTDLRPEGAEFAAHLHQNYGIEASFHSCDLSSADDRAHLMNEFRTRDYHFWGLLNVAGLDYEGPFLERTREQIIRLVRINIEASLDLTYGLLAMRDAKRTFRLLNVSSLAAFQPMPFKAMYAASKRFILDFSRSLAEELRGIATVTALCPAGLPTTLESMRRIFAQGFWGKMTAMDTQLVARATLRRLLRGRRVYVPGFLNQLIGSITALLPTSLVTRFVGKRWGAAQKDLSAWSVLQALSEPKQLTPARAVETVVKAS
ncbi:MAG: SDR family NAD(P)-dependent oxidoreductase [Anaerolineae bacterium]